MLNVSGIGSGLDIAGLVDSLVAAERAGSDLQLNRQTVKLQSKFSALGSLKSALSNFNASLSGLTSHSDFSKLTASSSDTSALGISVGSSAIASNYTVEISQLAQSHKLASLAQSDSDSSAIGTGSITIRFGTTDYDADTDTYNSFTENAQTSSVTIDIDSSNNTLEGIMNAVNAADGGVKATIVNDGSGYRLLLSSEDTGVGKSLEITVDDDDLDDTDASGLSLLAFNASATVMEQTVEAQDANFLIDGLSVTHSDNTVETAIEGLTFSLNQVTSSPVQVSIEADTNSVKTVVNEFITGYNQLIETTNALSAFNPETLEAAALVGDFTLRSVESQISSTLRDAIPLQSGLSSSLVDLGIKTSATGTLTLDDAKFSQVLENEPEKVMQLFAAFAAGGDTGVGFVSSTSATIAGTYAVNISALATAGVYDGTSVLPDFGSGGTVVIDGNNDDLTFTIDGVEGGAISLTQGTYTTGNALAQELQTSINEAQVFGDAGVSVTVTYNSLTNNLSITSDSSGSTSAVNVTAVDTDSPSTIGLIVGSGTAGTDITGTIGGATATGSGNILIGATGSDAEGLSLEITGTTLGSRGEVSFTRGIASQLDILLEQLLDTEGALTGRIDSIQNQLDDIEDRRQELELRWETVRERYTAQFNALDSLLSQLQTTSTFLEQQLSGLIEPNSINNS